MSHMLLPLPDYKDQCENLARPQFKICSERSLGSVLASCSAFTACPEPMTDIESHDMQGCTGHAEEECEARGWA